MKPVAIASSTIVFGGLLYGISVPYAQPPNAASSSLYNTAKQKLLAGKPIIGATILSPDPNMYCAVAAAGFDFTWIEMQHSPLTYSEVAKLLWSCRGAAATPMIRVPDATESDIQKATDIGALGVIVPQVETVEKAQAAVRWSKYPPVGSRSQGAGQYAGLYGDEYRQTANDNMLVAVMIESPAGAKIADRIATVPGVDVVFAASTDLGSYSGLKIGDPGYEALVTRIHDETLKAGRKLGGPLMWKDRPGFSFLQGPTETALLRAGAQATLGK